MNVNGTQISASTIKLISAVLFMGIWVGTIQADLSDKADKSDVAKDPVERSEVLTALEGIGDKLDDLKDDVKAVDDRQRTLSDDVAQLKAKADID